MIDRKHFEQKLLAKQRECQTELAALEGETRDAGEREVRDITDDATVEQSTSQAVEESEIVAATLRQVVDALRRLEEGTFGKCMDCERPIEAVRLNAVPWAAYCLEDQEIRDQAAPARHMGATL